MQAMILHSPHPIAENPLVLSEVPVPESAPGQIRLRVHVCGVCHTDLHTVEGELDLPKLPLMVSSQLIPSKKKSILPSTHSKPASDRCSNSTSELIGISP